MKPLPVDLWDFFLGVQAGIVIGTLLERGYGFWALVALAVAWYFGAVAIGWASVWTFRRFWPHLSK